MSTVKDAYRAEVVDPGDRASALAKEISFASHQNSAAVTIVPHQPGNFRGPVGWLWKCHILDAMAQSQPPNDWVMLEEKENDGAGGKPQFFSLLGDEEAFRSLGWEVIVMVADDLARSGRLPVIFANDINARRITDENFHLFQAMMEGFGEALDATHLVNITGEVAVMKHSVTAFCDENRDDQLVLNWGASCVGLAHKNLLITGEGIEPDMVVVGFWEPGYRCNGGTFFTNVLLEQFRSVANIKASREAMEFARKLTIPSLSYANLLCSLVGWNPDGSVGQLKADIVAAVHVTGGGVWGKLKDVLPDGVGAVLDKMPQPADVLLQGQELALGTPFELSDLRAYGTLHGGCGMLVVCNSPEDAETVIGEAGSYGVKAQVVGHTMESADSEILIDSRFRETRQLSSRELEAD